MGDNQDNLVNDKVTSNEPSKMPEDFWHLVHHARALAHAQIERRRQEVYQTFTKGQGTASKRIPMPEDFWEAISSEVEITVTLPPDLFQQETKAQELTPEPEKLHLCAYDQKDSFAEEIVKEKENQEENLEENQEENQEEKFLEVENEIIYLGQDTSGLTFKEAALTILTREKRSMTAREIANIAISEGLITSTGKTPDASVAGQIYTDIRDNPNTPFASVGRRTYILKTLCSDKENNWRNSLVASEITGTVFTEEVTGIVISGNFPWQEEKIEQATAKPSSLESNLAIESIDSIDSIEPNDTGVSDNLIEDSSKIIPEKNSQKGLVETQTSSEDLQELVAETTKENKKMGFKQAAFYVLERAGKPMTAREIVAIAIEESLLDSTSKQPDSSLSGQIYTELQKIGDRSVFRQIGPRTYGLAEWYKKNET
ncbi:MAG: hypothetical protein FD167_567 [bacterium]|nr:MAG: hypothetical protein FD167_567 [bacterium]